jgi:hypothetical protein
MNERNEIVGYQELQCPKTGVECNGQLLMYTGDVWHDPAVQSPNCTTSTPPVCTSMYVCVNDGCPLPGATKMECRDGYRGKLCAVCDDGYFPQLRTCAKCEGEGPSAVELRSSSALFSEKPVRISRPNNCTREARAGVHQQARKNQTGKWAIKRIKQAQGAATRELRLRLNFLCGADPRTLVPNGVR